MFTVKIIHPPVEATPGQLISLTGDEELICNVREVRRRHGDPMPGIHITKEDGKLLVVCAGDVYVMNESGSTVGKWSLGYAALPMRSMNDTADSKHWS